MNNTYIEFSKPKTIDGLNRPMPQWRVLNYQLQKDELFTMTDQNEWSFDGRYYGSIDLARIKGVITPVWV